MTQEVRSLKWLVPQFAKPKQMNALNTRFPVICFVRESGRIVHWRYSPNRTCPYLMFGDNGSVAVSPNHPKYRLLSDLYIEAIEYPERYAKKSVDIDVPQDKGDPKVVKVKFGKTAEEVRERAIAGARAYNDYLYHWLYHPSGQNLVKGEFPLELLPPEVLLRRAEKSTINVQSWTPPSVDEAKKAVNA